MTDDELKPLLEEIIYLLKVANYQRDGGRDPNPWSPRYNGPIHTTPYDA